MPLYEYECGSCGHRFERIQKFSDPPERVCPKCGGEVHKLIAAPAVQFKGSGWYVTDYAGKSKDKKRTEAAEGTKATEKSGEGTAKESKETKESKAPTDSGTKDTKPTKSTT
jgi:putative FmdB family regulatory protein